MHDLENYLMDKTADVTGTNLMPISPPTYSDRNPSPTKTIRKVGGIATFEELAAATALDKNDDGVSGEQVQKLPQAATIPVRVDVTGKDAPAPDTLPQSAKTAQHYALASLSRYPLDSYAQVKTASAYFDEYRRQMAPEHRREYASNLCKRASALGIEVSKEARHYGADGYANDGHVHASLDMRVGVIKEAQHLVALEELRQCKGLVPPLEYAEAISTFDKLAGLTELYDSDVPDPYWSTFGEKKAEDDAALLEGNDYIPAHELKAFAKANAHQLLDVFGQDFVDEFRKDPMAMTKSLPVDQRKMIIRIASSALTDPTTT